jgi:hypothetical protein
MASLGHIAVGMAASRFDRHAPVSGWSSMAWWSALSLLPDVDVVGFALGVNYGDSRVIVERRTPSRFRL